ALMDPDGGTAWLCFPGWSDPATFAGLLGSGGSYRISPHGRFVSGGYYEDGTLIWRRRFVTEDNVIECREALDGDASLLGTLQLAHDYGRQRGGPWRSEGDAWLCSSGGFHARWHGRCATTVGSEASRHDFRVLLRQGEPQDFVLELQCKEFG